MNSKSLYIILFIFAVSITYAGRPLAQEDSHAIPDTNAVQLTPGGESVLISAKTILGSEVRNPAGEKVGKLDQLMVSPEDGQVKFAILAIGGFLGINDKLFAVPWSSISVSTGEKSELVLNMDKGILQEAPSFELETVPDLSSVDEGALLSAKTILGSNVINQSGEDVGEIEELMIDLRPEDGRVEYAVLAIGGFLGINEKLFAMPWQTLSFSTDEKSRLVLNLDRELLAKAPSYERGTFPEDIPEWRTETEEFYRQHTSPDSNIAQEHAPSDSEIILERTEALMNNLEGWQANSEYNRKFDPNNIVTISGQVITEDRVTPIEGMSEGVQLSVRTDAGETVTVHLGPKSYLDKHRLSFMSKDSVEITGSRISLNGQPVIIATEVRKDDDVLALRSETGYPEWSRDISRK